MKTIGNFEVKTSATEILAAKAAWGADRLNSRLVNGQTYTIEGSTTIAATDTIPEWEAILLSAPKLEPAVVSINVLTGLYFSDGSACFADGVALTSNKQVVESTGKKIKVTGSNRVIADKFQSEDKVKKTFYTYEMV